MPNIQNTLSQPTTVISELVHMSGMKQLEYSPMKPINTKPPMIEISGIYQDKSVTTITQPAGNKRNIFGALKGKVIFKSNFDAPLPDEIINLYYGD